MHVDGNLAGLANLLPGTLPATNCDASITLLAAWPELQVLNKEFELLSYLAQQSATFSKRDGFVAMEGLAEKIHELKHKCV